VFIADLIFKIKKFGIENVFRRYYSIYPGVIVSDEDPKKRGRVRVKVPDIMGDVELVNWAEPILLSAGKNFGVFYPPKIGDYVWVQFRLGDVSAPVYMGGWWGKDEKPEFLSDNNKNAVFISRHGHQIVVDESEDNASVKIEMNDKSVFELNSGKKYIKLTDGDGNGLTIDTEGKVWNVKFDGKLIEQIKGEVQKIYEDKMTVTITKDGTISCDGKVIIQGNGKGSFFGNAGTVIGAEDGTYRAVLGDLLLQAVNLIATMYNSHIHICSEAGFPTSPAAPSASPAQPSVLSSKVKLV